MTERAWVLQTTTGRFHDGEKLTDDLQRAGRFMSTTHAQRNAQVLASLGQDMAHDFLYAIPIERETERVVEKIKGPANLYVLQFANKAFVKEWGNNECGCAIGDAQRFTPRDLALKTYDPAVPYEFIPVREIETPGEWKEVNDD